MVCERDRNRAQDFVQTWIEVGYRMGMIIKPPRLITLNNDRTDTFVKCIREEIQPKVKFVNHHLFHLLITENLYNVEFLRFSAAISGLYFSDIA